MKAIDVVFVSDKNYLQHFTVACTSLLENSNSSVGRIFLVYDIEYDSDLEKVVSFFYGKYKINIEIIYFDSSILDSYKINYHLSKSTYIRLFLAEILPEEINTVLYLDVDLVVLKDLSGINRYDFCCEDLNIIGRVRDKEYFLNSELYIYAVDHDLKISNLEQFKIIGYDHLYRNEYFNAGVLLINLKKWREDNITPYLIQLVNKSNNIFKWMDQDLLNIAFNNSWGKLDYTYNVFKKEKFVDDCYKIIHYIGPSKPWYFKDDHPFKYLYWQYLRITPYKYYIPPDMNIINIAKKLIPLVLKRHIKIMLRKCLPKTF